MNSQAERLAVIREKLKELISERDRIRALIEPVISEFGISNPKKFADKFSDLYSVIVCISNKIEPHEAVYTCALISERSREFVSVYESIVRLSGISEQIEQLAKYSDEHVL